MTFRDYHVHSLFSNDCFARLSAQCEAALAAGIRELCFTEHVDLDHPSPACALLPDYEGWWAALTQARARYPALTILAGIEAGDAPGITDRTRALVRSQPFDFVLLSQHVLDGVDPYSHGSYFEGRTQEAAYARYAHLALASVRGFGDFDALAHLGYCAKFAPFPPEQKSFLHRHAPDEIDAILRHLAQNGKALEINSSGLRRSPQTIPGPDILARYRQLGGEFVTLGSDAHDPRWMGYEFPAVREQALALGFRHTLRFRARKATPVAL